jgi:dimethylargininase
MRAFVRNVSPLLGDCELSHQQRVPINLALAQQQHANYVQALESAGVTVQKLPDAPEFPDGVFVEDPAVILDELAIICRSANPSRLREIDGIIPHIQKIRRTFKIEAPGSLEGGDVLRVGKRLFVGISNRTNVDGIRQLTHLVAPFGYEVSAVQVTGCLHLKTAVTALSDAVLLANTDWVHKDAFRNLEVLTAPGGANTLTINGRVFVPASAKQTAGLLRKRGFEVAPLDISEFEKAEAGLTCLSLVFS